MKKLHLALVFSTFLIVSGCSEKTSDEYIALAETNIQQGDVPSAIIELKNAISVNAQDPRARFLLGNLYANRGSSAAAEKELIRAFELGYEPNEVLPVLANAYSLQFKHEEIIKLVDESRSLAPEVSTSLLLYKALAHFQLGQTYKAKKAVADANEISADSLYSKLGNAYVDFSNQQVDKSLEKINEILSEQPDFADAHLLKGQLTSVSNDNEGAVKSFEKYKELLPRTYQSRVFLATAYIKNKQFEEAEKEVDLLLKVNPDQPYVNQLKGAVRFQVKDFENAKLYTEKAIQNGLSNVPNRIIAGVSAFRLGHFEQAYRHIDTIKNQVMADNPIQKLLIILQLKLGHSDAASDVLDELDGLTEDDVILLSAATAQFLKEGNISKAKELASRANQLDYSNPLNLAQKGMLLLTLEDLEGITDLESALQIDPNLSAGNTALARAYIDNGLYQKAFELSEVWIAQTPDKVNGYILAAKAQVGLNNKEEAEVLYQQILELDIADPSANIYFADLNVEEGNQQIATNYLLNILDVYKYNVAALTKYFIVMRDLGDSKKGLDLIDKAYRKNLINPNLQLLYVKALYIDGKYEELVSIFSESDLNEKTSDSLWLYIANAQLNLNRLNVAENVFKKWLSVQPDNRKAYVGIIVLNDILGTNENALRLIRQASQKFPDEQQFKVLKVYFYLKSKNVTKAKLAFEQLPSEVKDGPVGNGFQGQILLLEGNVKEAIPMLKQYYDVSPTAINATLFAKALKDDNRLQDAMDFLNTHVEQNGVSVLAEIQIAELSIISENFEQAELAYRKILQLESENIRALNNLAYLLVLKSEYSKALPFAEQAALLTPENPAILDILSQVLLKTGDISKALDYAQKAYSLDSSSHKLLVNLAEALVINGKKAQALEILALLPDNAVEYKDKAEALINQL